MAWYWILLLPVPPGFGSEYLVVSDCRSVANIILQTVLVFLAFISSALQYLVHSMTYKRDLQRVEWIIEQARSAAWGSKMQTLEGKRKVCWHDLLDLFLCNGY